jgi:hypothetical protein
LLPSNPQVLDTEEPGVSYVRMAFFAVVAVLILWVAYVLFSGANAPAPPPQPTAQGEFTPGAPPPTAGPSNAATGAADAGTPPQAPKASAPNPATLQPGAQGPGRPGAASTPPPTGAAPRATGPVEGRQKLELTMRGLERTWVRLSIDRAPAIDVLMQPAETVAWEANQEIRLTIGRSNGVSVYLNGEEILLPPESNRLIPNLVLNKLTLLRLEN